MKVAQIAKSKTAHFNTWIPAIAVLLNTVGIAIPAEVVAGVLAIGNFLLRLITKEPVSAK